MKFKIHIVFILISIISLSAIDAQTNLLSLDEAIKMALQSSYDIQLVKNDLVSARLNDTRGNAGMLPRVNAGLSDNLGNSSVYQKLANGNEIQRNFAFNNALNANISATYTLFDGYRMYATKQRLSELVKLGEINAKAQIQNTIAAVSVAYYDVVRQQQQLRITDTLMAVTSERVRLANVRFEIGTAPKMDLLQSKVDFNVLKSNRLRQMGSLQNAKASLNLLLQRLPGVSFEVNNEILLSTLNVQDVEQAIQKNNGTLQAIAQRKQILSTSRKEISAGRLPTVSLNGATVYNLNNAQAGFTLVNRNVGFNVGFSATMPLYDAGNIKRQEALTDIEMQNRQIEHDRQQAALMLQVNRQFTEYTVAREQIRIEESNLPFIEENLNIAVQRFKLGQSMNILEIKEIQRQYEDSFNRSINARYSAKLVEIELARISQ